MGNLDAIQQILEKHNYDQVCIEIGNAQESYTLKNPLTAGERFEIIETAFLKIGIRREKFSIFPIPDIYNNSLWPYHILQLIPKISALYSGSQLVKILWKKQTSIPVKEIKKRKNLRIKYSKISTKSRKYQQIRSIINNRNDKKFNYKQRLIIRQKGS